MIAEEIRCGASTATKKKTVSSLSINEENIQDEDEKEGLVLSVPNVTKENEKEIEETKLLVNKRNFEIFEKLDVDNVIEVKQIGGKERSVLEAVKKRKKRRKERVFSLVDQILSIIVIAPLVIGFWRGVWTLMDFYTLPAWPSFFTGLGVHLIFAVLQHQLQESFIQKINTKKPGKWLFYRIVQIFYTHLFGVACNAHWRGGWMILKEYMDVNMWIVVPFTCLCTCVLIVLRCTRNLVASPFLIFIDLPDRVFLFPTRYNMNSRDWSLYILDCVFSVGVVGTLVVFVWRGVWILFDLYLFPEDREYTAVGSLVIGYVIVAVTFCLQPLMRYICTRLEGLARLIAADIFLLLSFLGTVNVWRGIWMSLDLWLLPEKPVLSCWITHLGCFVLLVLLNCSNSILVRGVYIDAEEDSGKCVVFPCHYLRLFFKIEREKKEARRRNLLMASKDLTGNTDGSGKDPENGALLNSTTMPTIIPANPESLV